MILPEHASWRDGDVVATNIGREQLVGVVIRWNRASDGEPFIKVKLSAPPSRIGDIIWPGDKDLSRMLDWTMVRSTAPAPAAAAAPPEIPAPRVGLHVAGPVVDGLQVCARCGDVLASLRPVMPPTSIVGRSTPWPDGAKIRRGNGWQAEYFGQTRPDCEA